MSKFTIRPIRWRFAGRGKNGTLQVEYTCSSTFYSQFGPVHVREGDTSDGGSAPRILWPVISPLDSDMADAAFVHDTIYRDRHTKFTRKQADLIMLEALQEIGMPFWKRQMVYRTLRACGWKAWSENRQ